jgi:hypothetical protein
VPLLTTPDTDHPAGTVHKMVAKFPPFAVQVKLVGAQRVVTEDVTEVNFARFGFSIPLITKTPLLRSPPIQEGVKSVNL